MAEQSGYHKVPKEGGASEFQDVPKYTANVPQGMYEVRWLQAPPPPSSGPQLAVRCIMLQAQVLPQRVAASCLSVSMVVSSTPCCRLQTVAQAEAMGAGHGKSSGCLRPTTLPPSHNPARVPCAGQPCPARGAQQY
jgi:hypothetical protein